MAMSVDEYLAQFPDGAGAYADVRVKAGVMRDFVSYADTTKVEEAIGSHFDVNELLTAPVSSWVPEVQANAIYLAVRHTMFDDDDAFVDKALELNRQILRSPVYRGLSYLFTKERILKIGTQGFALMHRGMTLRLLSSNKQVTDGASWELTAPSHLLEPVIAQCYGTALLAAAEMSRLPPMRADVVTVSPTAVHIHLIPN